MRRTSGLEGEVISQAIYSEEVRVLRKEGNALQIQTDEGYQGWVPAQTVLEREPLSHAALPLGSLFNHIYRVQDTRPFPPLTTLPYLSKVEVELTDQRWLNAKLIDGTPCFLQQGDLLKNASAVIPLAKKFLGLPYTWGGKSSFGFDCSGLIQTLFRSQGVILPRDAKDQASDSRLKTITQEEAGPGDLIFFGQKIFHVGLIVGQDQFLHATVARMSTQIVIHTLQEIYDTPTLAHRLYKRLQP